MSRKKSSKNAGSISPPAWKGLSEAGYQCLVGARNLSIWSLRASLRRFSFAISRVSIDGCAIASFNWRSTSPCLRWSSARWDTSDMFDTPLRVPGLHLPGAPPQAAGYDGTMTLCHQFIRLSNARLRLSPPAINVISGCAGAVAPEQTRKARVAVFSSDGSACQNRNRPRFVSNLPGSGRSISISILPSAP